MLSQSRDDVLIIYELLLKNKYSEQELIKGCKKNKRLYQEALFRKYYPKIMTMCMRYAKSEDVAMLIINDGFLKVFKQIHTYEGKGSFEGWIRRICFRCLSDHFRKEKSYLSFMVFDEFEKKDKSTALNNIYYEELLALIEKLPFATARVFRLYAIEGFKHREIADLLQISEGTSKWHLSEARTALKKLLKGQQESLNYGG